ncbi:MAG: hypothetical protein SFX73_28205 [Kofleriaceae bacterium]|nr:hypothetical protein [Kofleriaceae bacterium]
MRATTIDRVPEPLDDKAPASADAAGGSGMVALERRLASNDEPRAIAALLAHYPQERDAMLAHLHRTRGNTFVAEVVSIRNEPSPALEQLEALIGKNKVTFVGETDHGTYVSRVLATRALEHAAELGIAAVVLEQFYADDQPVLDAFNRNEPAALPGPTNQPKNVHDLLLRTMSKTGSGSKFNTEEALWPLIQTAQATGVDVQALEPARHEGHGMDRKLVNAPMASRLAKVLALYPDPDQKLLVVVGSAHTTVGSRAEPGLRWPDFYPEGTSMATLDVKASGTDAETVEKIDDTSFVATMFERPEYALGLRETRFLRIQRTLDRFVKLAREGEVRPRIVEELAEEVAILKPALGSLDVAVTSAACQRLRDTIAKRRSELESALKRSIDLADLERSLELLPGAVAGR